VPRASRYFLPGYVWHITHRCHKKEFLLKFHKDRANWIRWLFKAKKRYGLRILNYVVTSNHIHLLVQDIGNQVIPRNMHWIAGRMGQAYNQRKGAFWSLSVSCRSRHLFIHELREVGIMLRRLMLMII
jgi:putative transposase